MKIYENSNKSYTSMVVHPQELGYPVVMHQIIHCFKSDAPCLLNLLFKLLLL